MRVIINADDFGYSTTVNDEIDRLMSECRVTSATIMANGPAFQDAISRIEHLPKCSFGVHLNLTEFAPLTQPQVFRTSGIVDDQGSFTENLRRVLPSVAIIRAIVEEWTQQIEHVQKHGCAISHVDSHHHVHTIPWLFPALKTIQRRFGIRRVRTTMNWYHAEEHSPSRMTTASKQIWAWALRSMYTTTTTDIFTSFGWFIATMPEDQLRLDRTAELMCHPGQPYAVNETGLLWSDWAQQMPHVVSEISYHDL